MRDNAFRAVYAGLQDRLTVLVVVATVHSFYSLTNYPQHGAHHPARLRTALFTLSLPSYPSPILLFASLSPRDPPYPESLSPPTSARD